MLYDFQQALLRIYTSERALDLLKNSPDDFFNQFTLSKREKKALRGIPTEGLEDFQRILRRKRVGMAKLLIQRTHHVVLMPFWKDSPALAFGNAEKPTMVPVSVGIARLIRKIYSERGTLSLLSLLDAYTSVSNKVSVIDLFQVTRLMYSNRLIGSSVFV